MAAGQRVLAGGERVASRGAAGETHEMRASAQAEGAEASGAGRSHRQIFRNAR